MIVHCGSASAHTCVYIHVVLTCIMHGVINAFINVAACNYKPIGFSSATVAYGILCIYVVPMLQCLLFSSVPPCAYNYTCMCTVNTVKLVIVGVKFSYPHQKL